MILAFSSETGQYNPTPERIPKLGIWDSESIHPWRWLSSRLGWNIPYAISGFCCMVVIFDSIVSEDESNRE